MIQVNRIYLIFNRLVTKKFLVDTSVPKSKPILNVERVSHLRSGFVLRILPIVTVGAPLMDTIPFSFTVLSVV